ncbi:MAG: DnaD domain protein [Firmicutes bacterium]|nr:DnaD domain protein [Bacillota bacterium]
MILLGSIFLVIGRSGLMKEQLINILSSKKMVLSTYLIKVALDAKLNLNEFLVLVYFDNCFNSSLDIELISNTLGLDEASTMEAFNGLMIKGLVNIESCKDLENRTHEVVTMCGVYDLVCDDALEVAQEEVKTDIFKTFEKELGRTISSMELELINGWLTVGVPEEIILGALREAVYNGVTSFKYIDRIIYEWDKKGFKTMDDVNKHLMSRREMKSNNESISKKEQEVADYDWVNE